jgi:Aspartyl/Asparaginyl beta-hydroxylase
MIFPDRLKLGLDFEPARLSQDLSSAVSWGWRAHFNRQDYDGGWDVIPLRAPDDARHPIQMISPNPMAKAYVDTPVLERCLYFREVLAAFACPLRSARLMRLAPGAVIKEHTDDFLDVEDGAIRLHIPVVTNDAVDFRLNRIRVAMAPGTVWYLRLSDPHSIANGGASDRVHLLIDMLLNKWLVGLLEEAEKRQCGQVSAA